MKKTQLAIMEFLSNRTYYILFILLAIVYTAGLFVPLMDNDSAHHAGIALHMYLTGDYTRLVDQTGNYLDKPHLLFWLAAFCYKIFGVTGFAYKFPSFLFTILGTYSTYRLGKALYNKETGKLAALIIASSFAYILANNDVRMDAILTGSIAFATWQLVAFVQTKSLWNIAGAALGLALGFSTKGHIAVFAPAAAILFYIFYRREWKILLNWKWLLLVFLFAVFISPMVYAYYLQYNLHPEIVVRGKNNIDGVQFILLKQSIERFGGEMGKTKTDYSFFIHSFLWAFAPWSIIAFIALFQRIKNFGRRKEEWLTAGGFTVVILLLSFSGFKLPHYVNITFPLAAIMTAFLVLAVQSNLKWISILWRIQLIVSVLILLLVIFLNGWAFPVNQPFTIVAILLFLIFSWFYIKKTAPGKWQRLVLIPALVMILSFFLLNTNFYPRLLQYQGGNELAFATKGKVDPANVYFWKDHDSPSFLFYTASIRKEFADSVLPASKKIWLLTDETKLPEIKEQGYQLGTMFSSLDYPITKLKLNFINPATREKKCSRMILVQVSKK